MNYYFSTTLKNLTFETAKEKVTLALKEEGFGVLTNIDVKKTLKKKLGVDFRPYEILGACNPHFAYKALSAEDKIGIMLPCNVVIEENENGAIEVSAVDPIASMGAVGNNNLEEIGEKLLSEFSTNFKMLLEYVDSLPLEQQEIFLDKLVGAVDEIDNFINDLGLNVNDLGVH